MRNHERLALLSIATLGLALLPAVLVIEAIV
jgi:hypothetical protein